MTTCKNCGKEFESVKHTENEPYDRGDGVMYGTSSWSQNMTCPHCGTDNSPKVIFSGN